MKTHSKYLYITTGFFIGFILYFAGMTYDVFRHNISILHSLSSFNHFITPLVSGILSGLLSYFYWRQTKSKIEAHQLLLESEIIYKTAFRTSPDSVNINTLAGIYVDINEGFTALTQYTRTDVIGVSSSEIKIWAIPEDREKLLEGLKETGWVENLESLFRCKDGSFKTALMSARIIDIKGKPHILSVTRDITERKKIENALGERERHLNAIYQAATNVSFITINLEGKDSIITSFSPGAENIFGYKAEEMIGKPLALLHKTDDVEEFPDILHYFRENRKGYTSEKTLVRKSGEKFPALLIVYPLLDKNNELYSSLGISIDITDLKNAQKELIEAKEKAEESDRLKTAFLNNISHEVRTPLNAITGFTQLLTKPNLPIEKIKKFSDIINEKSNKLIEIITDVIEISQIQAHTVTIKNTEFDFIAIVKDCIQSFEPLMNEKELQFTFNIGSTEVEHIISSDKPKISKIFQHILDNAIKFTHHGQIKLDMDLEPAKIEFTISDSGIGISKEMQQKIFDPFRQIETGLVRNYGGTGLGLSIIKAYTELLNGTIILQSQPNIGTNITVSIPAVQIKNKEILTSKTYNNQYKTNRILIVEDEVSNFEYLKELFSDTKAEILYAPDGQQAIEICRNEKHISFILMDIKMPVLDGHSATKLIKAFRPDLPIIAQTAHALESDKEKFMESGFDAYICKPIQSEVLFAAIDKYII